MYVRAQCLPSICIQGQRRIGYADLTDPAALTRGQGCGTVVTVQLQRGSVRECELSAPAVGADIEEGTIARNGDRGAESAYRHPPGAALAVGIAADPEAVGVTVSALLLYQHPSAVGYLHLAAARPPYRHRAIAGSSRFGST